MCIRDRPSSRWESACPRRPVGRRRTGRRRAGCAPQARLGRSQFYQEPSPHSGLLAASPGGGGAPAST
eukprot:7964271-Alexandrium_andersonii.AAC.1